MLQCIFAEQIISSKLNHDLNWAVKWRNAPSQSWVITYYNSHLVLKSWGGKNTLDLNTSVNTSVTDRQQFPLKFVFFYCETVNMHQVVFAQLPLWRTRSLRALNKSSWLCFEKKVREEVTLIFCDRGGGAGGGGGIAYSSSWISWYYFHQCIA